MGRGWGWGEMDEEEEGEDVLLKVKTLACEMSPLEVQSRHALSHTLHNVCI